MSPLLLAHPQRELDLSDPIKLSVFTRLLPLPVALLGLLVLLFGHLDLFTQLSDFVSKLKVFFLQRFILTSLVVYSFVLFQ